MKNVANRVPEKGQDYSAHDGAKGLIDAGGSLHAPQIQCGEQSRKHNGPKQPRIRNLITSSAQEVRHRLGAPDGADQWIDNVIHGHAPAGDIAQRGMQLAAYIGVRRTRAGIDARHPSITHRCKNHRHHRDQNRGDDVSLTGITEDSVSRHGCRRLNDDDPVQDQVPQSQSAAQTQRVSRGFGGGGCHVRVLDYAAAKLSTTKVRKALKREATIRPSGYFSGG